MLEFELVIPAYNEEKSLPALVERVAAAAKAAGLTPAQFQLVLVENGSSDGSQAVLQRLAASSLAPWFRAVRVVQNQGYGFGLWSGLKTTTAPHVGWSHADLQCDPADAFRALAEVRRQAALPAPVPTLVKGTRHGRAGKDIFVSRVFALFAKVLLGLQGDEINAQPKVFHRQLLQTMTSPPYTFAFDLYTLYHAYKAGFRVVEIDVQFPPRVHGVSKWAATFFGRYKTILGMIAYMRRLASSEGRL